MKPMLASDAVESKIKFPCIAQPKIDGVRSLNQMGTVTGRSLKTHANLYTTQFFTSDLLIGLDGEMAADRDCCKEDLCRITSSALSTIEGEPFIQWWLFDYICDAVRSLPYLKRLEALDERVSYLTRLYPILGEHLRVIPWVICNNLEEFLAWEQEWLDMGYEGAIVRDINGKHKKGRSTVKEGGLLRVKRFVEEEALVLSLVEGETNLNEKQTNELGNSFRSSHKENKVPNGMVGSLSCRILKDIMDPYNKGRVLFAKGQEITVSPGTMTHQERVMYFEKQSLIVGKIIKFKFFPKGIKDKPRFPNFQTIRGKADQ